MARSIVWTSRASNKFDQIIGFLEIEWNQNVTRKFVSRTYDIIDLLIEWPNLGKIENEKLQIRGFRVSKHNRMFYRTTETEIIILNFFDHRQGSTQNKY